MNIIITVNCNENNIEMDKVDMACDYPRQTLKILEEILNRLNHSGVILEVIDEDSRKTIGEW